MDGQSMMGATILVTIGRAMEWAPRMSDILIELAAVKTQAHGIVLMGPGVAVRTIWSELEETATSIALR